MFSNIIVFILGSMVGSFLNVCIYRLPLKQSIVKPRSHCPQCKKTILWYDNIPLVSYFVLRGRCRFCGQKFSFRYFLVEVITASMFLIFYIRHGLSFDFIFYTLFVCALIIAAFVDIAHRIIPDEISMGGIAIGFILNSLRGLDVSPLGFNYSPLLDSLFGIIIGAGVIYLTGKSFDLVYFRLLKKGPIDGQTQSMGIGDVKLLAMIGAFLGYKMTLLTFFVAPIFGVIVGLLNLAIRKQHVIPYGPFLSLAAVINLFWAHTILRLIFFR